MLQERVFKGDLSDDDFTERVIEQAMRKGYGSNVGDIMIGMDVVGLGQFLCCMNLLLYLLSVLGEQDCASGSIVIQLVEPLPNTVRDGGFNPDLG